MPQVVVPSNLLKQRLDRFTRVLSGVEKGDVRALHRARVASRRLRELVPVLQLEAATARKLSRKLRKVTTALGRVRELDVLLLLIDELETSRPMHRDALRRVGVEVRKSRDEARKHLFDRVAVDDMWRLARKLQRIVDELRQREQKRPERRAPARPRTTAWAIDARASHRAARLRDAMQHAGAVYLPERLHDVRIALKKLRYALELREESANIKPSIRTLKRVQTVLGRMHDLQVLIDRVRDVQASLAPPSLTVWRELDALLLALDDSCRRLHARYVRERPALAAIVEEFSTPPGETSSASRRERRAG